MAEKDSSKQSDEDTILEQTSKFRNYTEHLKQELKELITLRKKNVSDKDDENYKKLYSSIMYNLTSLRSNHRTLYIEIERNRIKNQKEKETLDENLTYLESLVYQKNYLNNLISGCKNFNTPALNKINECRKSIQKLKDMKNQEELSDLNEEILKIIKEEYEQRKQMKEKFEDLENKKRNLKENCEEKKVFLNKLPNEIKKISDIMKDFMDIFKIDESLHPEQTLLAKQLPLPLYNIYYKLCGLSLSKLDSNISITIIKKEKPESGKYKIDNLELVLLIDDTPESKTHISNIIKKFKSQNIDLNSIYPLKLYIRFIIEYRTIVIQVDNKNFFTTEEIIANVLRNDPGTLIFLNPKNEQERNLNNKYQLYQWIQNLSGNSSNPHSNTDPAYTLKIMNKIRNRIFSRIVLKCIVEDLKKDPLKTLETLLSNPEISSEKPSFLDKVIIKSINEIHYDEYHALLKLPEPFRKKLQCQEEKMDIEEEGTEDLMQTIDRITKEKNDNKLFEKYEVGIQFLRGFLGLEKKDNNDTTNIYLKLEIEIKKLVEITIVMRINNDYPYDKTKFTIYAVSNEEKKIKLPDFLNNKVKKTGLSEKINRNNKYFLNPCEISKMENYINNEICKDLPEKLLPFSLIIQIKSILSGFVKKIEN